MSNFAEAMADHEASYAETAPAETGPVIFTDGQHEAVITVSRIEEGQYGFQWVLTFRGIDTATKKPASVRKWTNLPPEDAERESYLKADRQVLNDPNPDSLSALEQACVDEIFIGLRVRIGVKTKRGTERDYTNTYINGLMSDERVDPDEWLEARGASSVDRPHSGADDNQSIPAGVVGSDDDIPFEPTTMQSGRWGF